MAGIQLPNGLPVQAPPMILSTPFNDVQLVAMIAAQLERGRTAAEAVAAAIELVAEAVLQAGDRGIQAKVSELRRVRDA